MSLLDDNVIPGSYGMIFSSNAKYPEDQTRISKAILQVEGVKDVVWNEEEIFPKELTVHTHEIVPVKRIADKVKKLGFNVIPKQEFPL
ncbi:MAG: heavy-metal-associated domain-containing protein [Flavobacteriales bacterium]|nr:heavy-metal-associated domain-containing protein [Flavobacteriales bacterium]